MKFEAASNMEFKFYLPTEDLRNFDKFSSLDESYRLEPSNAFSPVHNWVWSTYMRLHSIGLACVLTDQFPKKGIAISASCTIPIFQSTSKDVCHICAAADSPPRFFPQIHVLQNPLQCQEHETTAQLPLYTYIPHWTQPNLIPRDPKRGDKFENIGYLGSRSQLAHELQSIEVQEQIQKMGLTFQILDENLYDYSQIDAVLAVRSFDQASYLYKPASKLVNAWLAGVPAVLGPESAFQAIRHSSNDYIEVRSLNECLQALKTLKGSSDLRREMINNGYTRAKEFSDAVITQKWVNLLQKDAPRIYSLWLSKGRYFQWKFHFEQYRRRMQKSLNKRVDHLIK